MFVTKPFSKSFFSVPIFTIFSNTRLKAGRLALYHSIVKNLIQATLINGFLITKNMLPAFHTFSVNTFHKEVHFNNLNFKTALQHPIGVYININFLLKMLYTLSVTTAAPERAPFILLSFNQ